MKTRLVKIHSSTILHALAAMLPLTVALIINACILEGQTVNWYAPASPPPRAAPGWAYDAATLTTVLFGGAGYGGVTYGDTWIWQNDWHQLSPPSSPSPRQAHAMAYDGAAHNVVLFGGCSSNNVDTCTYLNDTWIWDGTTWTQQFPAQSPSPRATNMVYDAATKTVVLFGGANSSTDDLGDTWT